MLFFFDIVSSVSFIYVLAAALPCIYLLKYVYSESRSSPKPGGFVWQLIGGGMLAAICSLIPEYIASYLMSSTSQTADLSYYVRSMLLVGIIEEGFKFLFLKRDTWNSPYFETRFDGITFAVTVSLGFALFENVRYVFAYGIQVAFTRAFLAIPAHMAFAVLMGWFYGRARFSEDTGSKGSSTLLQILGYISAVALHTAYDTFASIQSGNSSAIFIAIVFVIYLIVFALVRHEAKNDRYV